MQFLMSCIDNLKVKLSHSIIFKGSISRIKNLNKHFHVAHDFRLIILNHEICKKVQQFLNIVYKNDIISTIKKPTSITKKTVTA